MNSSSWILKKLEVLCKTTTIYIRKILEEHLLKCEQSGKFLEAEMAKQKISQLKAAESQKEIIQLKGLHEDEVLYIYNYNI